jgi:signal peptidase I
MGSANLMTAVSTTDVHSETLGVAERVRPGVAIVCTFAVATAAALSFGALLPVAVPGWSSYLVRSDSMSPALSRGDVLIARAGSFRNLGAGTIVVFDEAAESRVHRIERVDDQGRYITKGDANGSADTEPVPPGRVRGVGRMVVPYIGLPAVWLHEGRHLHVALLAIGAVFAVWASRADKWRVARGRAAVQEAKL